MNEYLVAAFYCFKDLEDGGIEFLQNQFNFEAQKHKIRGTVLIAAEGVNGTICGAKEGVEHFLETLKSSLSIEKLEIKYSWTLKQAFRKFKARRKSEIVTMGISKVKPNESVGTYVEPSEWNDFINDPETIVIDTRNEYEVAIGSFDGSLNPHTETFREFPCWVEKTLRPLINESSSSRIAMFCTGGIRCEKATSYLKSEGFSNVYHLHGGILNYFKVVPESESLWKGECFVFDQRVSLNHKLKPGIYRLCHACGRPLSPEDLKMSSYIPGIQCQYCEHEFTDEDRERFAQRQKQINLLSKMKPGNLIWPNS